MKIKITYLAALRSPLKCFKLLKQLFLKTNTHSYIHIHIYGIILV